MTAPDHLVAAVERLSKETGQPFKISDSPVTGTRLYVVYADDHPFPANYTLGKGILGFRVPENFPDAEPEDSFFIAPATVKLKAPDAVRKKVDIHRASAQDNYLQGVLSTPVLVFSWHLWNTVKWDRRKHTLVDHYTHVLRRFEQQEHD